MLVDFRKEMKEIVGEDKRFTSCCVCYVCEVQIGPHIMATCNFLFKKITALIILQQIMALSGGFRELQS